MSNSELTQRIKELRKRKGISQEELAEMTGLSLRTIQRIENGETEPRSDSLKRLADAFDIQPDEITDWTVKEDKGFLTSLNLSGLISVLFPILGIIVSLMMWYSKKDKVRGAKTLGRDLINFEITCTVLFFVIVMGVTVVKMVIGFEEVNSNGANDSDQLATVIRSALYDQFVAYLSFNIFIVVMVLINTRRIKQNKEARYYPKISFFKT